MLTKIRVPWQVGRPRVTSDSAAADKAHSNRLIRNYLPRRGIRHTIPEKSDSCAARARKAPRGVRPPGFDAQRNTIEWAINKLKQYRAVATRYDKRGYVFLGTVTVAALRIWLRS